MNQYGNFQFKLKRSNSWFPKDWEAHNLLKKQMQLWCAEQHFDNWGLDDGEEVVFWFFNEQDYALFLLRWS
jgi:hypothetical protein